MANLQQVMISGAALPSLGQCWDPLQEALGSMSSVFSQDKAVPPVGWGGPQDRPRKGPQDGLIQVSSCAVAGLLLLGRGVAVAG